MVHKRRIRKGPIGARGKEVRIVTRDYKKKKGWIDVDAGRNPNPLRQYVIVDMGGGYELDTNLWIFSLRDAHEKPKNREEAMLQEHPDIEADLIQLCRKMAACEVHNKQAVMNLVKKELTKAVKEQCLRGNTAKWRELEYDSRATDEYDEGVYGV